jgi:predicted  nucleic acid-binding Zn-ribbon protein
MKEKDDLNPKPDGHSPIEAIRNIIFGDQEKSLNHKLDEIFKKLDTITLELSDKINEVQERQDKERKQLSQKITKIQTIIEDNEKDTAEKLEHIEYSIHHTQSDLDSKKLNRSGLADQLENLVNYLRAEK